MILTDAGPLVALIVAREADHERCRKALDVISLPLVTTWAAFTEAMYLVIRAGESRGREALWRLVSTQRLVIRDLSPSATLRCAELMSTYSDLPMDLADATLVALAEEEGFHAIFTLDSDFHVYRLHGRIALTMVPGNV